MKLREWFIEAEGGIDMNENLIHNLKHVKECLVNKEMVGEDWEERQEVLVKLEDVVTYLNDATEESINFEE